MVRYRSAVDWWIALLMLLSPLLCFGFAAYYLWMALPGATLLIAIGVFSGGIVLIFLPCEYTLLEDHLLIRSGLFKKRIQYTEITEIKKSRCPLSAPALSLNRIMIHSSSGRALISPEDRDAFIEELAERSQLPTVHTPD